MQDPAAKNKKSLEIGKTKFEYATTIRGEPLLQHDVRVVDPHGNAIDVPAEDIFRFAAAAFVAPHRQQALTAAVEDGDFTSVLLGRI
ncbi:MAG: hypothetical protein DRJ03_01900 [Chloroflexi bacterium]|nr:MAG: hypothetical protein DRJ03_01900 [Chloroflexota bacterium]